MPTLRERTIAGLFWNISEKVGQRLIQLLPTILLARLLSPDEFGLVGMLTVFILLAQAFLDSGFGLALIQKKNADFTDECSVFYFNLFVGVLLIVLLFFAAPAIAAFYRQPLLVPLTRWLSLDIFFKSFAVIQTTLLTRNLDFKTQLKASLIAPLFGGIIGVAAAYAGWGVWSLVAQTLSASLLYVLALWRMSAWRPALLFSASSLKSMFAFGSNMLFTNLVGVFLDNFYQVFIGKAFSASVVGYYTRAASLKNIVVDTTSNTLGRVLFPALAKIQDETERLKLAYRKTVRLITFVHFPLMLGLIAAAPALMTLLFSEKWSASILLFQLMCGAGLLYPLQVVNLEILKVKGRSDLFFQLALIKRGLMLLFAFLTYRWGVPMMLVGQIVNTVIAYGINSYYSGLFINYPLKTQIADALPNLFYASVMTLAMWRVGAWMNSQPSWLILLAQTGLGAALFLAVSLLARAEPFLDMIALGRQYLRPRLTQG